MIQPLSLVTSFRNSSIGITYRPSLGFSTPFCILRHSHTCSGYLVGSFYLIWNFTFKLAIRYPDPLSLWLLIICPWHLVVNIHIGALQQSSTCEPCTAAPKILVYQHWLSSPPTRMRYYPYLLHLTTYIASAALRLVIRSRMVANRSLDTAASAISKIICRARRTIRPPILISPI